MKVVTLKSLHIQNFGNIKDMTIEFGKQTYIKGKNESGKTTIGDAYSWLMTNHLMNGGQAGGIRPVKNGVREDFVDIVVEAVFDIGGRDVTIQKTQSQEWTTKDGKFKGNVNKYMINDIPKKEKEYREYIEANIMTQEKFELCTNATALLNMDNTKRRTTLFRMVSEFSDEDVINTEEKFNPVRDMLPDGTVEELIARAKYQIGGRGRTDKGLQGKLDEFPARIDEASKKIADVAEFELKIDGMKDELDKLDEQEQGLNDLISAYDQKSKKILDLKIKKSEIIQKANEGIASRRKKLNEDVVLLEQEKRNAENDLRMAEMDLKYASIEVRQHESDLKKWEKAFDEWKEETFDDSELDKIKAETFDENNVICPVCHREFPENMKNEKIQSWQLYKDRRISDQEKKKNDFDVRHDERHEEIRIGGVESEKGRKSAEGKANLAEQKISKIKKSISDLIIKITEKEKELSELPETVDLSSNIEYQEIASEIVQEEETLRQMDNGSEQKANIKSERDRIVSEISSYQAQIKASHDAQDRVNELEAQRKETAQKLDDCQRELDLLRDFQKKKCEMLTEQVNALFKYTKWVLFKFNEGDDGYREICEPSYKGIKYNERLNHGGRSLIDLDICNAFQNFYGVSLPIVLDDFDGVTGNTKSKMDVFDRQVIYLVADEGDLRIEQI